VVLTDNKGTPDLNGRWDLEPYALETSRRVSNDGVSLNHMRWDLGVAQTSQHRPGANDPVTVVVTLPEEAAQGQAMARDEGVGNQIVDRDGDPVILDHGLRIGHASPQDMLPVRGTR
jgi:hypothetical protein